MMLFSSYRLGQLELPNRVVMAPMTRSRAVGALPNDLMRDYYAQRASAGLIITEGVAPSPNALGYARIPGIYTGEQAEAWRRVASAVHAASGRIFVQLMHTGRIAHPDNLPAGARIVAPSAVRADQTMWTDSQGAQPLPTPEEMTQAQLSEARDEIVRAAERAIDAGMDGIELHGANGYLLEQFLNPHSNRRNDAYGGGPENRARFVVEVSRSVVSAIGADRVGLRLSPYSTFNDLPPYESTHETYRLLAEALPKLAYVHLVASQDPGFSGTAEAIRRAFGGPMVLNGGFDRARAETVLESGQADLIAFGRPFISNPDLVRRLQRGSPLATPKSETFYTPGPEGYLDYPTDAP